MWNSILKVVIADAKCITREPVLLIALISPLILILFLLLALRCFPDSAAAEKAIGFYRYYSVISVSLLSCIPFIYGLIFSYIHNREALTAAGLKSGQSPVSTRNILLARMSVSALISFIIVLPAVFLTHPVRTEGWLRSLYASGLLALMSPFIFAFPALLSHNRMQWRILSASSLLFLLAVPLGLLFHHPWNYLTFFSPFYWLSWAWIIPSPSESFIYGLISMIITATALFILYRKNIRRVREG